MLKYNNPLGGNTVAGLVLGQPDFSHNGPNEADASSLYTSVSFTTGTAGDVAIDSTVTPPRLYVADFNNNRVLGFDNATGFANDAPADIVLGQPDFFSNAANQGLPVGGTTLNNPIGLAVDKHRNLYVGDYVNSQVLEFDAPVTSGKSAHSGTGSAQVTVSTAALNFGNVAVDSTSKPHTATVTNNQSVAVSISVAISGTNAGDFSQTNTCGSSLAAFKSCMISVTFKPTARGARSATLKITDSPDTGSPHSVALGGTGSAQVTVAPTSLTFQSQLQGTTSAAKIVTVTNNQSVTLVINSISIGGTNPGDFSQTDTCGIAIAAFANCTVSVKFTPATTGTRTATLMISDSPDSASPHNVTLTGTGS